MSEALVYIMACLLAAFCSGSETAFSAAGRIRIMAMGKRGGRALWFLNKPSRYLVTTLVGTNVGVVLASSVGHGWGAELGGIWEFLFAFFTAVFLLVFAEVIPKQLALFRSDSFAAGSAPVLQILRIILYPIIAAASSISGLIAGTEGEGRFFESRKEVNGLLLSAGGRQGRLASAVISMGEVPHEDYSCALKGFPGVDASCSRERAVRVLRESGEDFLLVWEKPGITLAGAVRGSKLVRWDGTGSITRLVHGLPYYHSDFPVLKMLPELWRSRSPAAVLMDMRGQPGRLVTPTMILARMIPESSSD